MCVCIFVLFGNNLKEVRVLSVTSEQIRGVCSVFGVFGGFRTSSGDMLCGSWPTLRASLSISTQSSAMLSINCLLVTNTCRIIGHVFVVDLPPDERVDVLRQEVKKRGEEVTENVPSFSLTAWKPLSFFPSHPHHDLANHVHGLNLNSEDDVRAATSLDPAAELQDYFTEPPPPRVVHVVIQLPSEQPLVEFGLDLPRRPSMTRMTS